MASVLYIDANRQSSLKSDSNTNEWEYKYSDEGLVLPAGTQVSIVDTFINKRGISGNSITIEKTITETIYFSFYMSDNEMRCPVGQPNATPGGGGAYNMYDINKVLIPSNTTPFFRRHPYTAEGSRGPFLAPTARSITATTTGFSELPMFACRPTYAGNAAMGYLEPVIENIEITIPAGTYSVIELGHLIDDQLTGRLVNVKNLDYDTDFIKQERNAGNYDGTFNNRKTYTMVKAVDTNLDTNGNKNYTGRGPTGTFPDANYDVLPLGTGIFCPPAQFRELIKAWTAPPPDMDAGELLPDKFSNSVQSTGLGVFGSASYMPVDYMGLSFMKLGYTTGQNSASVNTRPRADSRMYQPMDKGYYIGTPDIEFSWNADRSAYQIKGLHQSWRVPSHDVFMNKNESVGEEAVLLRRVSDEKSAVTNAEVVSCLQNPVERYGGICVFNWAQEVAEEYGDVNVKDETVYRQGTEGYHKFLRFQDYFTSERKAEEAWRHTLWYRLGFKYDDLQSERSWENNKLYDNLVDGSSSYSTTKNYGKTTRADLSIDITPSISTTRHPLTWTPPGASEPEEIRTYNNLDINTPLNNYGLNVTVNGCNPTTGSNAGSYSSSYWTTCSGTQILTSGRPIIARDLPALNQYGYFVVTSDIIEGYNDSIKKGQNLPLLGVVPISNLASQDFITTRNEIVHVLNQPKVLNSIKIKVLNPDLSNPNLDDFSSIVLKIEIPLEETESQQKSQLKYTENANEKKK